MSDDNVIQLPERMEQVNVFVCEVCGESPCFVYFTSHGLYGLTCSKCGSVYEPGEFEA